MRHASILFFSSTLALLAAASTGNGVEHNRFPAARLSSRYRALLVARADAPPACAALLNTTAPALNSTASTTDNNSTSSVVDPTADVPTADDPTADDPTADDPTADPTADDPTAGDPTADDPTADDPTSPDDPAASADTPGSAVNATAAPADTPSPLDSTTTLSGDTPTSTQFTLTSTLLGSTALPTDSATATSVASTTAPTDSSASPSGDTNTPANATTGDSVTSLRKRTAQADLPDVAQKWQDLCLASGGDIFTNEPCVMLAGVNGINALLANAGPCDQQDNADAMIDFAKSPGVTNSAALIAGAIAYRSHARNTLNILGVVPSSPYCQTAPRNPELNGIVNAQLAGNDPGVFGGPTVQLVPFGAPGTCPFNQTADVSTCTCTQGNATSVSV